MHLVREINTLLLSYSQQVIILAVNVRLYFLHSSAFNNVLVTAVDGSSDVHSMIKQCQFLPNYMGTCKEPEAEYVG